MYLYLSDISRAPISTRTTRTLKGPNNYNCPRITKTLPSIRYSPSSGLQSLKNKNLNMYLVYYHVVTKMMVSGIHVLLHPSQHPNADLVATLNVVIQNSDKAPTLLPWERFCHKVWNIQQRMKVCCAPFISCASLTNEVISHRLDLILECRFWCWYIDYNWLIVSINEGWFVNRNTKHT